MINIDYNSRCAQYYIWYVDLPQKWQVLLKPAIKAPVDEVYYIDPIEQFHPKTFKDFMYVTIGGASVILLLLLLNSYKFGIKQGRFCQSSLTGMFYVFSIFNMLLYIGLAALTIENTNKGVNLLELL